MKRRFSNSKKRSSTFWNKEYRQGGHLKLSTQPSEDMQKFLRWQERTFGRQLVAISSVADLGCGNGRNLIYLAREYGIHGWGCDVSETAIKEAGVAANNLPIEFAVRSVADPIPLPAESQDLVLDMMTSHFLNKEERNRLRAEIYRILKPAGWLFFKTFLLDEDLNAERLIRDYPATESNTYIHPSIGVPEHVSTVNEIEDFFSDLFVIHKIVKSFRHRDKRGRANKRRSISAYLQKKNL